ncbi:hypothetical protein BCR44DRAFT_69741 [Catenaria anguillulae PL171]|uniref:Uncharacterized protein n=1 Tax=Catenaria anguillulae PL171 TaxID=765915 RepID=A0A1Y2HX65_9FUNG|nr:hypothetical protein BCR44DRAFT_69741 [Catenaria anguillulae PL171]
MATIPVSLDPMQIAHISQNTPSLPLQFSRVGQTSAMHNPHPGLSAATADLLATELLHLTIALARPRAIIPKTCSQIAQLARATGSLSVQIAWRNCLLLGGSARRPSDRWGRIQYNMAGPNLSRFLQGLLRPKRKGWQCATATAPSHPLVDPVFTPLFFDFLLAPTGPLSKKSYPNPNRRPQSLSMYLLERMDLYMFDLALREDGTISPDSAQWWGLSETLLLAMYFLRSGQLDRLSTILDFLVTRGIFDVDGETAPLTTWRCFLIDNRPEWQTFFADFYESVETFAQETPISFTLFLCVIALFDWSVPALEIILSHSKSTTASAVPTFAASRDMLVQDAMFYFLPYCRDATRITSMVAWFDSAGAQVRLDRFPMTSSKACRSVFTDLMEKVDLPLVTSDTDRSTLCWEAMRYALENPKDLAYVLDLVKKHELLLDAALAMVLGQAFASPQRFPKFVKVIEGSFQGSRKAVLSIYHCAIQQQLGLDHGLQTAFALYGRFTALGGNMLDFLVPQSLHWNPSAIATLFRVQAFQIPWSKPATLVHILNKALDSSNFASHPALKRACIAPTWLRNLCALLRAVFGACLGRCKKQSESLPLWLKQMSHAQLALLLACHLLHHSHRTQVPNAKSLRLPSVDRALNVLLQAWNMSHASSAHPDQRSAAETGSSRPPLSSVLPDWLTRALMLVIHNMRTHYHQVSFRIKIVYNRITDSLIEIDHDLVLATICAASNIDLAPHSDTTPRIFSRYFVADDHALLKKGIALVKLAVLGESAKWWFAPSDRTYEPPSLAHVTKLVMDNSGIKLDLVKGMSDVDRDRVIALGYRWMWVSAQLDFAYAMFHLSQI